MDEPTSIQRVRAKAGETTVRTPYLADGKNYRFRARHWSFGTSGNWTAYVNLPVLVSNTTPPSLDFSRISSTAYLAII